MNSNESWYGYVVECADGSLYCGITTNVNRRVHEHNYEKRGSKYCKSRRPVMVVMERNFKNRKTAEAWERNFKKLSRKKKVILVAAALILEHVRQGTSLEKLEQNVLVKK